jgi:hypothetical protein
LCGTANLKFSAEVGWFIAVGDSEAHAQVSILPLLLERKSLILKRIGDLQPQQQIDDIKGAVASLVSDDDLRGELLDSIQQSEGKAVAQATIQEQEAILVEEQRERFVRLEVELQERRSDIWLSFLHRNSVASIIGAMLLLGLGVALVVAMFTHTSITEVVANSFLLILGYFFGQAAAAGWKSGRDRRRQSRL